MQPHPRDRSPLSSVLAHGQFRALWCIGTFHEFARRMELLVLSWLILQVTDSYFQLGLVLFFNNVPRPLLALFSGIVADRVNRQLVLLVSQVATTLTALIVLGLLLYDINFVKPWMVYCAILQQGASKALEDPSRRTAILDVVGEARLVNALSLDVVSHTAGKMVGPILGGVLLDTVGFSGAYIFVIVVHFVNLAIVARLRVPPVAQNLQREPMLRSMKVAIRYAVASPSLAGMLYVTIIMNALVFPIQQFIPAIGRDHLHVSATLVGLLVAADGFGQLAGAGLMAMRRQVSYHGRIFVGGSIGITITAIMFVWSPWYALAFTLLAVGGLGQSGFSTMQSAITMLAAPQDMRGRMMGLLSFCIGVGTPVGVLEMGYLASAFMLQGAISANLLAGLILMLPVAVRGQLVWQPLRQVTTDTGQTA